MNLSPNFELLSCHVFFFFLKSQHDFNKYLPEINHVGSTVLAVFTDPAAVLKSDNFHCFPWVGGSEYILGYTFDLRNAWDGKTSASWAQKEVCQNWDCPDKI